MLAAKICEIRLCHHLTPVRGHLEKPHVVRLLQSFDSFARVLAEIPYYEHIKHVTNALKQAGFTAYKQNSEEEMFSALEKHANEAANKEAA